MRRKGQSIVEYLLIFAGIIAAILVVKETIESNLKGSYNQLSNEMSSAINYIDFGATGGSSSGGHQNGGNGGDGGGSVYHPHVRR